MRVVKAGGCCTSASDCNCRHNRKINLSQVFAGQLVGVRQETDRIWLVSFMRFTIRSGRTCHLSLFIGEQKASAESSVKRSIAELTGRPPRIAEFVREHAAAFLGQEKGWRMPCSVGRSGIPETCGRHSSASWQRRVCGGCRQA